MKSELKCSIVRDLLPNYIEKLTSEDTNEAVEEHLKACGDCNEAYEQMVADMGNMEKAPAVELKFLKKIKRTRLMAAALCIMVTVGLCYALYASEFKYINDKGNLSAAITEYTSPFESKVDAYVLETEEIDGVLIASFKDRERTNVNGLAFLSKGINGRYRITGAKIETSEYSSVIQKYSDEIKGDKYYIVSGYNISDEVEEYGLDYCGYKNPGTLSKDRVRHTLRFEVENSQFLDIYNAKEMDEKAKDGSNQQLYYFMLLETSMYDANGMEITENFRINEDAVNDVDGNIAKAELNLLYVFMAIVAWIGYIITKYILTD